MLTSSCCGQHRLDLEKFKLILLSCCVNTFPSSDIKLHHIIFCSLHLSLSGVLCPFLNTLSKKCVTEELTCSLWWLPVVGMGCVWHMVAPGLFLQRLPPQLLLSTPGHPHLAQESFLRVSLPAVESCGCTIFQFETEQGFPSEIQQAIPISCSFFHVHRKNKNCQ